MSQPVYFWLRGADGTRKCQKDRKGAPQEQGGMTQVWPTSERDINSPLVLTQSPLSSNI